MNERRYESDKLTVTWNSEACIHSGHCAKTLPDVFRPTERPWIDVSAATDAALADAIDGCPSKALGYEWKRGEPTQAAGSPSGSEQAETIEDSPSTRIQVFADGPYEIAGTVDVIAADGSLIKSSDRLFLCRCGASKNKPFCDGSHKKIGFTDPGIPAGDA